MQKQILERFIAKYTLGGMIEILPWKSDGQRLFIETGAENRDVIVQLSCSELRLPSGEYYIYETAQLRSLLNILGDDITLDVKTYKDKPVAFTIHDEGTSVDFALATPESMPQKLPQLNSANISEDMWTVTFDADAKFATSFVRAKGALNVDEFTIKSTKDTLSVILGYAELSNSTRVTMTPAADIQSKLPSLKFNANCLREILMANKEATAKIRVSEDGLMHIHYDLDGFVVDYYLTLRED
jgi:hypothetical protein